MKVLIICYNIMKPSSGPPSVVRNLLNGFIKTADLIHRRNVEITFLSLYENIGTVKVDDNVQIKGLPVVKPITLTLELQSLLKRLGRFDIVHTHVLHYVPRYALSRTLTIYTMHGVMWNEIRYYTELYLKIPQILLLLRFKTYLPLLTKLVVISPYLIDELKECGIALPISKIELIENPVSDQYFNLVKKEDHIILYPARFFPLKNQLAFIKALSLIKNDIKEYKVIFAVGSYYDKKYLTCAKNYVQKKDLRNVEFTRCSLKDMIDLYSRASFVALTSFQETLPMSVLEAMSSGTPVLVSNIKPMRYIVEDGVTGLLVDPSNPRDIAEKILLLINDGDLRKKIGLNAKRVAEKRWRSEVVAEKHLKLYEEIVEESDKHV